MLSIKCFPQMFSVKHFPSSVFRQLCSSEMQSAAPLGDDGQLMSSRRPVLWLSTHAVQLTVPIGDDGQLMSGGPPVLWLSTDAIQLTVPIGDDGQRMS